jgi:hypothetical protein
MKEMFGWIFLSLGTICGIAMMIRSLRYYSPMEHTDSRPFAERECDIDEKITKDPVCRILIIVGLICSGLGMYLIGMFG